MYQLKGKIKQEQFLFMTFCDLQSTSFSLIVGNNILEKEKQTKTFSMRKLRKKVYDEISILVFLKTF